MKNLRWILAIVTSLFLINVSPLFAASDSGKPPEAVSTVRQKVNINQADAQTLADNLSGIGLKRAQAIVEYRERYGRFNSAEDLQQVKGVGLSIIEKNVGLIEF